MEYNFIHLSNFYLLCLQPRLQAEVRTASIVLLSQSIFCAMGKCSEITAHVLRRNCWVNSIHWMILSFSVLDELVPYTWTTFSCTVQKSCSSILFLISNVPTGRRTMSLAANAFFYPLDEPLGPFSPLQNGKESTVLYWYFKFTSQHFYHKRNIFLWILG